MGCFTFLLFIFVLTIQAVSTQLTNSPSIGKLKKTKKVLNSQYTGHCTQSPSKKPMKDYSSIEFVSNKTGNTVEFCPISFWFPAQAPCDLLQKFCYNLVLDPR